MDDDWQDEWPIMITNPCSGSITVMSLGQIAGGKPGKLPLRCKN
ncbi:hypothetical protein APS_2595 [Acetobacter pasteurianus subsp. pasteurianus LMG 1262 = NBRC 106471]|nr:hypothetical protein APS_2595 [Acetobacter pasteurianus subsp. pasteurianus LMG 1262 = NBRC 106471]